MEIHGSEHMYILYIYTYFINTDKAKSFYEFQDPYEERPFFFQFFVHKIIA